MDMPAHIRKNSNSNLKIPGANVDTGSLGVLMIHTPSPLTSGGLLAYQNNLVAGLLLAFADSYRERKPQKN
jgi:hypothetical protein